MCRLARVEFDAEPSSAAGSRQFVAEYLRRWELSPLSDVATLLTSELVTNAVVHGEGVVAVVVAVSDGFLEVGVTDRRRLLGPFRPKEERTGPFVASERALTEHGHGLDLVDSLATVWDTAPLPEGKQVWFRLDVEDWCYRTACRCRGDNIDRVRLESGGYALAVPGRWDPEQPQA